MASLFRLLTLLVVVVSLSHHTSHASVTLTINESDNAKPFAPPEARGKHATADTVVDVDINGAAVETGTAPANGDGVYTNVQQTTMKTKNMANRTPYPRKNKTELGEEDPLAGCTGPHVNGDECTSLSEGVDGILPGLLRDSVVVNPFSYNQYLDKHVNEVPRNNQPVSDWLRFKMCRHGHFLFNAKDMYIGESLNSYGEWSESEIVLFRSLVSPGDVVVDVGAHIGTFTIPFAKMAGPAGQVIAIEPQRLVFQMLNANIALNGAANVITHRVVAGEKANGLLMHVPDFDPKIPQNFGGISMLENWRSVILAEEVDVITIDSLELEACKLIKVDGERMELAILRGSQRTITEHHPYVYVESDRKEAHRDLTEFMISLDYQCYWVIIPLFMRQNFFSNEENVFGNTGSFNMLCMHETIADSRPNLPIGFQRVHADVHPLFPDQRL
eukprot:TRINITY_DN7888_c0_g1_i1.p1 TRINITY_DN7888_c0_g1~~TRINITY_DN7888_c0_g1_i1.p1  ORF type:complete len:480 (-),score=41.47 TRINITY_DN7888_c0_g1_i1:6-1337(-)